MSQYLLIWMLRPCAIAYTASTIYGTTDCSDGSICNLRSAPQGLSYLYDPCAKSRQLISQMRCFSRLQWCIRKIKQNTNELILLYYKHMQLSVMTSLKTFQSVIGTSKSPTLQGRQSADMETLINWFKAFTSTEKMMHFPLAALGVDQQIQPSYQMRIRLYSGTMRQGMRDH